MTTIGERILAETANLPEGQAICAKGLLHLGRRAGVDQALARLARRRKLLRAGRGLYVRPVESRFGTRAPSAEKVVESIGRARGEMMAAQGAVAANRLGLTTQVPLRSVFLTSGRNRSIMLGQQTVELRHAPKWQFEAPGEAGCVVRALAWAGPERAAEIVGILKGRLPASEMAAVASHRARMPVWMARHVGA